MRYIHDHNGTRCLQKGLLQRQWILAAGMYHFAHIPLPSKLSASQRARALKLQVDSLSPYLQTGYQAVRTDKGAQVWFWNEDAIGNKRVGRLPYTVLPQTLMQSPMVSGIRLVSAVAAEEGSAQGVEAQYWHNQTLLASRYWPAIPSAEQWLDFLRVASVPVEQHAEQPAVQTLAWLDKPYAGLLKQGPSMVFRQYFLSIQGGIAVLLLLFAATQLIDLYKYQQATERLMAETEQQRFEIQELLMVRGQAIEAAQSLAQLHELLRPQQLLKLLEDILNTLPLDLSLYQWQLEGNELQLTLEGKQLLNTAAIIEKLLLHPLIKSAVAEDISAKRLKFTVSLEH